MVIWDNVESNFGGTFKLVLLFNKPIICTTRNICLQNEFVKIMFLVEQSGQGEESNPISVIGDNPLAAGNNLL